MRMDLGLVISTQPIYLILDSARLTMVAEREWAAANLGVHGKLG